VRRWAGSLLVLAVCSACSGTSGDDDPADAGPEPDGSTRDGGVLEGDFGVEVGTGLVAFETVDGDDVLDLIQGPQSAGRYGGYHIWMAVRLVDIEPIDVDIITLSIETSTTVEAMVMRRPAGLPFEPCDDGQCAAGFAPRLDDCCRVSEQPVTLKAFVIAKNRRMVSASVEAKAGACLDAEAPVCD
jgi:hypothetical protein